MEMDSTCAVCPQCSGDVNNQNRIITDSCGHRKCRQCFLSDEALCLQCDRESHESTDHILEVKVLTEKETQSISGQGRGELSTGDTSKNTTESEEPQAIKSNCRLETGNETDKLQYTTRSKKNTTVFLNDAVGENVGVSVERTRRETRKSEQIFGNHILQQETEDGNKEYHCTVCKKSFKSRSQIYYHQSCGSSNGKKYKCKHCEKKFSSRSHLNYHLESHENNTYNCSECKKSFTNEVIFKKHQKSHQQVSIKCPECGRSFRCRYSMKAHLAKHKNILSFACELCDKRYSGKSTLQQHMLKHKEKKHQCSYCGNKFQRNSTLKLHMRRHVDLDDYRCTICPKVFRDSGALTRHCKIHTGSITFKCIECNTTSVRKDNIMRHIRHIHNGKNAESCLEILYGSEETRTLVQEENREEQLLINEMDVRSQIESDPKTIRNSSVIKCVGNVEPVIIPSCSNENQSSGDNSTIINQATTQSNIPVDSSHETKSSNIDIAPVVHKKLKKKYDPIEMYLKILNSDEDPKSVEQPIVVTKPTMEQTTQRSTQTHSNFSEMHWRKNFKYTYQHQDYWTQE